MWMPRRCSSSVYNNEDIDGDGSMHESGNKTAGVRRMCRSLS